MADKPHSIPGEGTDVGIIGGLAVAVWFLLLDTIAGHPFQTPSLLGQVVLFGEPNPDTSQIVLGAFLLYTAFHFLVFALIGMGLVALVHWGIENPVVRYALLPVFLVFEVLFYGSAGGPVRTNQRAVPILGGRDGEHPGGGLHGPVSLVRHPTFRQSIRDTPLGAAPL